MEAAFGADGAAASLVGAAGRVTGAAEGSGGGVTDRRTRRRFDGDGCGCGERGSDDDDDRGGGVGGRSFRFVAGCTLTEAEPTTEAYDRARESSKHSEYDDHH